MSGTTNLKYMCVRCSKARAISLLLDPLLRCYLKTNKRCAKAGNFALDTGCGRGKVYRWLSVYNMTMVS
jgi:hypothetical protein